MSILFRVLPHALPCIKSTSIQQFQGVSYIYVMRLSQLLKGAVVVTLCQNEAEVKCQMDIDSHISLTEQAGKIRLAELTHQ